MDITITLYILQIISIIVALVGGYASLMKKLVTKEDMADIKQEIEDIVKKLDSVTSVVNETVKSTTLLDYRVTQLEKQLVK